MLKPRTLERHGATAGGKQPSLYQVWAQIKQRCFNPNCPKYKNYGARGIDMDPRWAESFSTFQRELEDEIGERPSKKHSLGRIDNGRGYWPKNVRWETATQQMRNTRVNHLVPHDGKLIPIVQAAEVTGVPAKVIQNRIAKGKMDPAVAAATPVHEVHGKLTLITWNGRTMSVARWAREKGMPYQTLHSRYVKMGWSAEKALTTPVDR